KETYMNSLYLNVFTQYLLLLIKREDFLKLHFFFFEDKSKNKVKDEKNKNNWEALQLLYPPTSWKMLQSFQQTGEHKTHVDSNEHFEKNLLEIAAKLMDHYKKLLTELDIEIFT